MLVIVNLVENNLYMKKKLIFHANKKNIQNIDTTGYRWAIDGQILNIIPMEQYFIKWNKKSRIPIAARVPRKQVWICSDSLE